MEEVCPFCNGLQEVKRHCPFCGWKMEDGGKIEDFFGPYSPYMDYGDDDTYPEPLEECVHLLYCPYCGHDYNCSIRPIRW